MEKELSFCRVDKHEDDRYAVDLFTDAWIRVIVEDHPSYERGAWLFGEGCSGNYEPRHYEITDIVVIESSGDSGNLHLMIDGQDHSWWPKDDVPFDEWLEDNNQYYFLNDIIMPIIEQSVFAVNRLYYQVELLNHDVHKEWRDKLFGGKQ